MVVLILSAGDLWEADPHRRISLGSEPVRTLLVLEDSVWASCGNSVTVMDKSSFTSQVNDGLLHEVEFCSFE